MLEGNTKSSKVPISVMINTVADSRTFRQPINIYQIKNQVVCIT